MKSRDAIPGIICFLPHQAYKPPSGLIMAVVVVVKELVINAVSDYVNVIVIIAHWINFKRDDLVQNNTYRSGNPMRS